MQQPPTRSGLAAWWNRQKGITKLGIGCGGAVVVLLCGLCSLVVVVGSHAPSVTATPTTQTIAQATTKPTRVPTKAPTPTPKPTPRPTYPPKTGADLRALAAQGDANAIHEFHSESVGLTGACPQPKREVTVDPSVTGKQLAEDLLAYFYGGGIDSPCGSIVFVYHNQSEANDAYTAGRIRFDTTDANGQDNLDPNATNLKHKLTLDIGDVSTGQEYVVTY